MQQLNKRMIILFFDFLARQLQLRFAMNNEEHFDDSNQNSLTMALVPCLYLNLGVHIFSCFALLCSTYSNSPLTPHKKTGRFTTWKLMAPNGPSTHIALASRRHHCRGSLVSDYPSDMRTFVRSPWHLFPGKRSPRRRHLWPDRTWAATLKRVLSPWRWHITTTYTIRFVYVYCMSRINIPIFDAHFFAFTFCVLAPRNVCNLRPREQCGVERNIKCASRVWMRARFWMVCAYKLKGVGCLGSIYSRCDPNAFYARVCVFPLCRWAQRKHFDPIHNPKTMRPVVVVVVVAVVVSESFHSVRALLISACTPRSFEKPYA